MIKIFGLVVFTLLGFALIGVGIFGGMLVAIQIGTFLLVLVVAVVIAVRIFPGFFESEDNARRGLEIIMGGAALNLVKDKAVNRESRLAKDDRIKKLEKLRTSINESGTDVSEARARTSEYDGR